MLTKPDLDNPAALVNSHQRSNSDRKSQRAEAVLEKLFEEFAKIYRKAFTNQYAWEDRDVWARQLKGVSMQQLESGFIQLRDDSRFETFPPNPIEFYCLCIGRDRPQLDDDGNDATWQHKQIERANEDRRQKDQLALENKSKVFSDENMAHGRAAKAEIYRNMGWS